MNRLPLLPAILLFAVTLLSDATIQTHAGKVPPPSTRHAVAVRHMISGTLFLLAASDAEGASTQPGRPAKLSLGKRVMRGAIIGALVGLVIGLARWFASRNKV
jgi:hypothetical protein